MKNAGISLLFVSAASLLLAACASQAPVKQAAPAPAASTAAPSTAARAPTATPAPTASTSRPATSTAPGVTVAGNRFSGTRRIEKDGVVYFCERPTKDNSHFIAKREQCFTETQLQARRDRDQEFARRQQSTALTTNTTSVVRTAISP
jgi:hypothetical protein